MKKKAYLIYFMYINVGRFQYRREMKSKMDCAQTSITT